MDQSEKKFFMLAVDDETNRLVWGNFYHEWPRMVPGLPSLSIIFWHKPLGYTFNEVNQLMIKKENVDGVIKLIRADSLPSVDELTRLALLREKCVLNWQWLRGLYRLSRSVQGYLPGVPLGLPGSNDRALFEEELKKVNDMIATEIANNHWRIWSAQTIEELDQLRTHLFIKRQRNAQADY